MELQELRGKHDGETIWVLGSGPSLNFIDPAFFADKTVVSTNFSAHTIGVTPQYMFSHYHSVSLKMMEHSGTVVTLACDTVSQQAWQGEKPSNLCLVELHNYQPPGSNWNPLTSHKPGTGTLGYGSSSLHGAMHLAAHLGASHIMLAGADCGTLDGEHRVKGYPDSHKLWELYNKHHKLMKDYLQQEYGVTTYSLNPFINLNLEGHTFQGVS